MSSRALTVALVALLLIAVAITGYAVGRSAEASSSESSSATVPAGHSGTGLPAHEFGSATRGARLFVSKGCSDCHSYGGKGGTDAPPLDYMAGHLSAREVADMSGQIWNHLPGMLHHFKEEGLPVPTFANNEMADLVAYLHSLPAKGATGATGATGSMGAMGEPTTSH